MAHLDIRGKVCPYPTTEVYKALQQMPAGERLTVLSDYPPARYTVPALVRDLDFSCVLQDKEDGTFTILIEKPVSAR